jgi:transposase
VNDLFACVCNGKGSVMTSLFWLSDTPWAMIEPFMQKNQPGAQRVDDRRVISGLIHVLKSGCRS